MNRKANGSGGGGGAALESETGNLTCSSAGAVREGQRVAPLTAVATRCVVAAEIQDWRQRGVDAHLPESVVSRIPCTATEG